MRKFLFLVPLMFLLTACKSEVTLPNETVPVSCVGLNTAESERDSTLVYKVSARNVIVGVIFFEVIAPPIIVALDELWCPVRRKTPLVAR